MTVRLAAFAVCLVVAGKGQLMTKLAPETNAAFEGYVSTVAPPLVEQAKAPRPLPWLGDAARDRVRAGSVVIRSFTGDNGKEVREGLVHDWVGGIFIPRARLSEVASLTQDFANHKQWYPEIIDSKLLSRSGSSARGTWLLKKKKIVTVVLRAEMDSVYHEINPDHGYLISHTAPIIEVADYGKPSQRDYPTGEGHGFLWRFNGYWNFHQADDGVYVECRVISLSRDVPSGLGWIVNPFIRSMPRESLESTLTNTKKAIAK